MAISESAKKLISANPPSNTGSGLTDKQKNLIQANAPKNYVANQNAPRNYNPNAAIKTAPKSASDTGALAGDNDIGFFQRVANTLSGAFKASTANYANAGATAYQGGQAGRTARNQELLEEYQYSLSREQKKLDDLIAANKRDPKTFTASDIESQQYIVDDWQRKVDALGGVVDNKVQERATQEAYKATDALQESAQKDIATAKQGLGKVGQFVVDAGVAGAQMAGDVAVGALVGLPMATGKGKAAFIKNAINLGTNPAMATRIFGAGSAQARQAGATYGQQVSYGALTAAAAILTNKLANTSGVFKTAFGKGVLDDALAKIAAKPLGKLAVSALSEGGEEMLENALDPLLQKITYNPDAAYDAEWLAETLYSGLIGAAMGVGGALVSPDTYARPAEQPTANPLTPATGNTPEVTTDAPEINAPQIAENAPQTMPTEEAQKPAKDPFIDAIMGGKRVDSSKLSNESFQALDQRGDVTIDAKGNAYLMTPEQHIDQRDYESVGKRNVNAFQFDHPELHNHMAAAAQDLLNDAAYSLDKGKTIETVRTVNGKKRYQRIAENRALRRAMDEVGLSRNQIIKAAQDLVANHGQENYAAAKRLELILDEMLTKGYSTLDGKDVPPNEAYINLKSKVVGSTTPAKGSFEAYVEENRLSLDLGEVTMEQLREEYDRQQAPQFTDDGVGAANASWFEANKTHYDRLVDQSTEFHDRGANPRDDIYFEIPKTDVQGRDISRSASNIVGAKAIPADVVPDIEALIADGQMSYNKLTDKKSLFRAEMTIRNQGFDGAMERFRSNALKGKIDKDTVSLGFTLLNNAANARDGAAVAELCGLIQSVSTNAGQALQAFNILRKMSPEAQLYGIQKMVDNLNENVKRKKPRKGNKDNGVPVDQWMQKTGEMLAKQLGDSVKVKPEKVQTVSQRVLADLRKLAKETVTPAEKAKSSRTEMDSIYDMFNNQEQYEKALAAAKETVAKEYGDDPEVMAALDEWMNSALDYTLQFTREVTGQEDIKVSTELMNKFLEQTTDEGRDAVKEEIYAEIAAQIPSTFAEKWNSWRYMSMLVNPRTHIRNIAGNTFFQPVRFIKNEIAAGLEAAWAATGHDIQRTKSAATSPALYKAAWADFDNVKTLVAGNKYSDSPMNAIQDKRKIYKNKALEFVRSMNMTALSAEDAIFKRITYADALAGYLKANGVTAEQMQDGTVSESVLSAARDYAAQEALKATYQDNNAISDKTTQIVKSLGAFGEAVMPFKKTPANVLARSLEYSPIGLIKGLTYDLHKVQSGDMSISQAFDDIAAGVTGTSIFVLGAILAAKGILRGKQGDEEEDKWDELLGHQGYAVELPNGTSITMDWLAPAAMPLFMGAEFMSSAAENGFSAEDIQNTLYAMSDPLLEMSMLQSLNDMIESVGYAKTSGVVSVIGSAISSYFSQAIPTLFGQIERVGEDERMTAYTDKNSALPTDLQYFLSKASAKIPGVDYQQIPYIDAWGRTEETGNLFEKAANNFLNPAYVSQVDMDSVESAIQKVYDATGESGVFPEKAERYINVDGERRELTADQYTRYAKNKGQKSYQYVKKAIATDAYKQMTAEDKAEFIGKMYSYANYKASKELFSAYEGSAEMQKFAEAEAQGFSPAEWYSLREDIGEFKADKDKNGKTISGSKKEKVVDYIDDQDLTAVQKDWLYIWQGFSESGLKETPWH